MRMKKCNNFNAQSLVLGYVQQRQIYTFICLICVSSIRRKPVLCGRKTGQPTKKPMPMVAGRSSQRFELGLELALA